ncbi:MAG: alkaline phosphatase family protein, partial [Halobacteriales archaeon]|nr:alkaline phosphatase family protein [Halobacteriales archaeon]
MELNAVPQPVVVIGLDCLTPQLAFEQYADAMPTLNGLAREGAYGRLRSVTPPITVPAWACSATGKTPGELGVYGLRNRRSYDYEPLGITTSLDIHAPTIWDRLGETGNSSVVIGVPPGYPPKPVNGYAISCFLTPGTDSSFTYPESLKSEIEAEFGDYWFDVPDFRHAERRQLLDDIHRLTEQRFQVAVHLMTSKPWRFFMFVDMGPDRLHHAFWQYADPDHVLYEPGNPFEHAMRDYYR